MRYHQKRNQYKTEQRAEVPPGIGKPIIAVQQVLIDLHEMTYRKQERSIKLAIRTEYMIYSMWVI